MEISIGDRTIGLEYPPFILAEMSGNHNQSLKRAIKIVEEAAKCGVDGVKLQTYTADTMTLNVDNQGFFIDDPKSPWKGRFSRFGRLPNAAYWQITVWDEKYPVPSTSNR